ncbi:MAG: DNA polymerase sliding clamp [Halobaculum sp.]
MSKSESNTGEPTRTDQSDGEDSAVTAVVEPAQIEPVLTAVESVVSECRLHFEQDGLRVVAADPAHVALVTVELDAAAFERYDAHGTTVGIDVERFGDLVGMADDDQPISLALDRETWTLDVTLGGIAYTMALLDPESVQRPPDRSEMDFPYEARLEIESGRIDRFVRAVGMVADYVEIGVDPNRPALVVSGEGDTDEVSFVSGEDELLELSPGDVRSLFSLGYVSEVSRAIPNGTAVSLRLGDDCPVRFGYEIADGDGEVEVLVSPRIQR